MKALATIALVTALPLCIAGDPVNPDAAVLQDFSKRVDDYVQLRKAAEARLPPLKATPSAERIGHYQRELAERIRKARQSAKQGDIFTPAIEKEFRRLIGIALQKGDASRIRKSLKSAEPVAAQPRINEAYPWALPLQSTPPTLLLNLPRLPPEIEYRLIGHTLVLWDAKTNLIIDFMTNVGT